MKKRHMAAALVLPLVFKAPAEAQGPADGRSEFRIASGPSIGGTVDARSPYLPLGGVGSGVRIDSTPIIQQDGSAVFRNVLVGGWRSEECRGGDGCVGTCRTWWSPDS